MMPASRLSYLDLPHGRLELPAFFPDGTYGVVRSVDAQDLKQTGTPGLVMNTYHLMSKPGAAVIKKLGGLHAFTGWDRPVLTDSGGFQVFSLIRENPKFGVIRKDGVIFRPDMAEKKINFTPQKCIQAQLQYGSDILMCLDYCTHIDDSEAVNREAVDTTVRWARICRDTFDRLLAEKKLPDEQKPRLFAIIQGGGDRELRKRCAEQLKEIGFEGFGFGGWPLDRDNRLLEDILAYTADLMPDQAVKYAMGVGKPEEVVRCVEMGYNLFDCVIPTREARRHRLTVFQADHLGQIDLSRPDFYRYLYLLDDKYLKMDQPLSSVCGCYCCRHYSAAYLHHLFRIGDTLAYRLATLHNLHFYAQLMQQIRGRSG